tara:strand:+ start:296 stop:448 length:153 start_codon:yes stop_codon:yes gene_type:complete
VGIGKLRALLRKRRIKTKSKFIRDKVSVADYDMMSEDNNYGKKRQLMFKF